MIWTYIVPLILVWALFGLLVWFDRMEEGSAGVTLRTLLYTGLFSAVPIINIVACGIIFNEVITHSWARKALSRELF